MSEPTNSNREYTIRLRNLQFSDYEELAETMSQAYSMIGDAVWNLDQIKKLLELFPEGQICIEVNKKVVAAALSLIVDYEKFGDSHTYDQITDYGRFGTYDPKGDILYGIDIFVHPKFRGMRLGRRLYDGRKELCENLNLKAIIAGGRIPGYKNYSIQLTPKEYIEKVKRKEIYDPILTFQMSNGFHVKKILLDYLPIDVESKTYATLIEWNNIYYEEKKKSRLLIGVKKQVVRVGVVQWQMRAADTIDTLIDHIQFFVDAVSDYKSDFILFPEFFNAPLMAKFNEKSEAQAIRCLAEFNEPIKNKFIEFAVSYNINIITGGIPIYENGMLRNVSYICRRNGSWDSQYKIHITPSEVSYWGMTGGSDLKVFDTDAGRIGILISYDVEFPELSRYLAEQGVEIIFVPFLTDTRNAYSRVRKCAQARAIENECYVAIAGCVGNLPKVNNMDIQYAQSAVFSPSDFSFPTDGLVTEATANAEMTLIADIDLEMIRELNINGSVRNLKDRRTDLYSLNWKNLNK
ncbi:MAG: bifunctional GNAT family N-acetyltransferase/carbon-nitrogen hydrolase family protein [Planctomycetota bacterium]